MAASLTASKVVKALCLTTPDHASANRQTVTPTVNLGGMAGDRSDASALEKAWRDALKEYTREVKNTLELLASASRPANRHKTIEQQRQAERKAFDKYRRARRSYLDFVQGVGGIAIVLGIHVIPLAALSSFFSAFPP